MIRGKMTRGKMTRGKMTRGKMTRGKMTGGKMTREKMTRERQITTWMIKAKEDDYVKKFMEIVREDNRRGLKNSAVISGYLKGLDQMRKE